MARPGRTSTKKQVLEVESTPPPGDQKRKRGVSIDLGDDDSSEDQSSDTHAKGTPGSSKSKKKPRRKKTVEDDDEEVHSFQSN
jgi:hypothetical protein